MQFNKPSDPGKEKHPPAPENPSTSPAGGGEAADRPEGAGNSTPAGRHASGGGTAGHGRQTAKKYHGIICRF